MGDESIEANMVNGKAPLAAARGLPPEGLSPGSAEPTAVECALSVSTLIEQCRREIQVYRHGEPSDERYGLELLRRALVQGDQDAWAGVQQCLSELVRGWLYAHPHRETAYRLESEENYVAQAFERFWQATTLTQQAEFRTLAVALQYLRASLNGVILDTLRAYARPREVSLPEPAEPEAEDNTDGSEVWEILKALLPNGHEQRVAYLLFHCGLKPREIVRFCPQEFRDIREIYRLRRNIMERMLRNTDHLRWRFNLQEQEEQV